MTYSIFVFPLLQPASRAYGEKRSVRPGPISRSSGNAERLGRQAETAFRGGARWRSPVGACAAGRPGGSPRHMRRAPSPGPAAAPPEQRRDGRRSAGDIGSSSELSAHFDDARKINSWNPVRDAVRRSLPWRARAALKSENRSVLEPSGAEPPLGSSSQPAGAAHACSLLGMCLSQWPGGASARTVLAKLDPPW